MEGYCYEPLIDLFKDVAGLYQPPSNDHGQELREVRREEESRNQNVIRRPSKEDDLGDKQYANQQLEDVIQVQPEDSAEGTDVPVEMKPATDATASLSEVTPEREQDSDGFVLNLHSNLASLGFLHHRDRTIRWHMIRILTLLPGQWVDPIQCDLTHAYICKEQQPYMLYYANPLGQDPSYEALSYTWGDARVRRVIELCGKPFGVGQNLESALRHLRKVDIARRLWIDAICIDQNNLQERSDQVCKMTEIYRQASRVIVWLGEESHNSSQAMDLLERLGGHEADMEPQPLFRNIVIGQEILRPKNPETLLNPADLTAEDWQVLADLLANRPWWSRMWTVQELTYAQEAIIVCGHRHITWDIVHSIFESNPYARQLTGELHLRFFKVFRSALDLDAQRQDSLFPLAGYGYRRASTRLRSLLSLYGDRCCTDPRDMIYALLGLFSLPPSRLQPDYTKNIREVYLEAAKVVISDVTNAGARCNPSLELLCTAYRSFHESKHDLPSWVPDWSARSDFGGFGFELIGNSPFNSSGSDTLTETPDFTADGGLIAKGIIWDQIQNVRDVAPLFDPALSHVPWAKLFQEWEPANLDSGVYLTGESALDAYWRTLLTNRWKSYAAQITSDERDMCREHFLAWSGRKAAECEDTQFDHLPHRSYGWVFSITAKGYYSMAPMQSKPGDKICIIKSVSFPLVLREVENINEGTRKYTLVGPAYVHGIMDGEVATKMHGGEVQEQDLHII